MSKYLVVLEYRQNGELQQFKVDEVEAESLTDAEEVAYVMLKRRVPDAVSIEMSQIILK